MLESGRHYGKKEKQIREEIGGTGGQCAVLHRMVRVGLTEATGLSKDLEEERAVATRCLGQTGPSRGDNWSVLLKLSYQGLRHQHHQGPC